MPKIHGVYKDSAGRWYYKVTLGRDPLTGKRVQVTKRGFATATDAGNARRRFLEDEATTFVSRSVHMTVDDLLDLYLDGIDADGALSRKTRFDYRRNADAYVRPWLGAKRVKDVTPEMVVVWQRKIAECGATKALKDGGKRKDRSLAPNTVRLARAPLAGAFRMALRSGLVSSNPLASSPRPKQRKKIPKHWRPEEARAFLDAMAADRDHVLWAFLLGSGLRIGELVWLRWPNVDFERKVARIVDFASTLGYELVESDGKSNDAVRTIDLDDDLLALLGRQRERQEDERRSRSGYLQTDYVFTKPAGGHWHPQTLSKRLAARSVEVGLPRLTAHGLRHTCATLMLANGVPPKVAAERLGHADPTLFTNLYSHVTPTMQRDAAKAIGAALFAPPRESNEVEIVHFEAVAS